MQKLRFSLLIAVFVTTLFSHCTSPSEEIDKAFETVNNSIAKSNQVLQDSLDIIHTSMQSAPEPYQASVGKANELYMVTKATLQYITTIKTELKNLDPEGENTSIPARMLVNTPRGDSLYQHLQLLGKYAQSALPDNDKAGQLAGLIKSLTVVPKGLSWQQIYFENTPTVAAQTILTKFEMDCRAIAMFVLRDFAHLGSLRRV